MNKCLWCDSVVEPPRIKYCSKTCDGKYKYHNNKKKANCLGCREEFEVSTKKVKFRPQFCSVSCANKNRDNSNPIHDYSKSTLTTKINAINPIQSFLSQSTDVKGEVSELYSCIYMSLMGWKVFKPNNHTSRVDYYADTGDTLLKVQVKTINKRVNSNYRIDLEKNGTRYSKYELDLVIAYCPDLSCVVQVPGTLIWEKSTITFADPSSGVRTQDNTNNIYDFIVMKL